MAPEPSLLAVSYSPANRAAFWTLVLVVVAVPLALAPGLYFFDITPKLVALVIGACALWALLGGSRNRLASSPLLLRLLAAQAVVLILSAAFSTHRQLSLVGSEWRRLGLPTSLACLAVAAAVHPLTAGDSRRQRLLLGFLTGGGAFVALYSLAQFWGLDPWIAPSLYTIGEGEWAILRPPGTLGYVSYLATYLLYVLFAAAGLGLTAGSARAKTAWTLAALAAGAALLLSGSRGAWLGMAAGLALLVSGIAQRRRFLLALLGLAALGGAFVLSPYGQLVRSRMRWFVEDPAGGGRLWLWRDSLRMAVRHPVLGSGPDTFERNFPPFQSDELSRRFPDRYFESAHNVALDYLTGTGAAGTILFLLLALAAWRNYYRASRQAESPDARLLARSLLAATAAALVSQLFIADIIPTRLCFLVFAALSFVWVEPGRRGQARMPILRLVAVACLAFVLFYSVRLWKADYAMGRARSAATRGDLDTVVTQGGAARRLFPWGGTYSLAFSRLLGNLSMNSSLAPSSRAFLLALAEDSARAALPVAANPQLVGVHLASLYVVEGRWAEAEGALDAAIRAAPHWYRPRWLLAELLSQQGRQQQAAQEARLALLLGAREHPEVAARCLQIERLSLP